MEAVDNPKVKRTKNKKPELKTQTTNVVWFGLVLDMCGMRCLVLIVLRDYVLLVVQALEKVVLGCIFMVSSFEIYGKLD